MDDTTFTHLHVHSEYSLLDGGNTIRRLIDRTKELGMNAVALTDHGNMFGVIDFYSKATAAGVKPIIGMEAYIAPGHRANKEASGIGEASHHLLLLAQNQQGYQNLLKLSSIAYKEGFYYRPRIDREVLEEFHEGLIVTSACMSGEISNAIIRDNVIKARETAEWYQQLLGERFYIEIQQHIEEQNALNTPLIDLANKIGAPLVATNDVHFLTPDDYNAHAVLCCISTGKLIDDENRLHYPQDLYLKSPEEMRGQFTHVPEACDNTNRIAEMCNVEFDFSKQHAPVFKPPARQTAEGYLEQLCLEGIQEKYGEMTDELKQRLDRELEVISGKGFASYFLIVWDFMNYARKKGIPCGTRGSGVGTLVGYVLDISNVDPLAYGLLFERFMDPERNEMPDIDVDICQNGRADVIDYVRQKYGHVAQIITFGTMKARAAIRDVCRVLNIPLGDADKLAKMIPETLGITLADALDQEPKIDEWCEKDPKVRQAIDISQRLEGMCRHASVHAAGVVIADEPLENFLPLYKAPDSDDMITQFDGPTVEKVGLLKMDFLGLRTLSTIERARELVKLGKGKDIDPRKINLKEKATLKLFADGRTKGVFQFESGGMRDLLQKMKPDRIDDLIAANALYRPGPMTLIPDYTARKHGEAWQLPHPIMEEVLNDTYGIMVYQEQVMQILNRLGDIPLARAYRLIKAISKKKTETIQAERGTFVEGAVAKGVEEKRVAEIFELIERFGGYGFNKSHSTQYAILAFQTAYFKEHYPTEFMAALLTFEMVSSDKVAEYIDECKAMGIKVLPPDVNECFSDFTVIYDHPEHEQTEPKGSSAASKKECIRFGLAAVKGVGAKAVEEIIRAREEKGGFSSLFDFCQRIDTRVVNKGAIEALIKAGALDGLHGHRAQLTAGVENALAVANTLQKDKLQGQMSFFEAFDSDEETKAESEKLPEIPPWPKPQMLQFEKDVLGMYVTDHPLAEYAEDIHYYSTAHTHTLREQKPESEVIIGGIINRIRFMVTKNGRGAGSRMAMLTLEDLNGTVDAVIFPDSLVQYEHLVANEQMVFLKGALDFRREEPSIRVNTLYDMNRAAEELTHAVYVPLEEKILGSKQLQELRHLCEHHTGSCPVYVGMVSGNNMHVVIQTQAKVRPDTEFCRKLEALLGHDNYQLLRPHDSLVQTSVGA
jgi:DNA polymerase-3 subunit alpha